MSYSPTEFRFEKIGGEGQKRARSYPPATAVVERFIVLEAHAPILSRNGGKRVRGGYFSRGWGNAILLNAHVWPPALPRLWI